MTDSVFADFQGQLMSERQRILNNSAQVLQGQVLRQNVDDLGDEADHAMAEIDQGLLMKLRDRERILLTKIDRALDKLHKGTFGICSACEDEIGMKRLKARPVTELCLSCKEAEETRSRRYARC